MKYSKINTCDIANGLGCRVSLFVSGCDRRCKGCFNEVAWNYDHGEVFTDKTIDFIVEKLEPSYIAGLSILGGEPMSPRNVMDVSNLVRIVKDVYPEKDIWLYTGYVYGALTWFCESRDSWGDWISGGTPPETDPLYCILSRIDYLVDGPFVEEEKDITLKFRGSRNQRVIDMKKTRETGKVVLWDEAPSKTGFNKQWDRELRTR